MVDVDNNTGSQSTVLKGLVGLTVAVIVAVFAWFVLVYASRLGWTLGWIYVCILIASSTINLACMLRWNPELIDRRMRFGKGTKTWDKVWLVLFVLAVIGIYVVVDIDARNGGSSSPGGMWLLGFAIFVPGWTLVIWSMVVNPFFEKTVRIQTDHGHRVIDTGPYAYVRHPGYVGIVGWIISTPLLLASSWAFIPVLITVLLFVIRTALEDRMLQIELSGYTEYANKVRYRLIPGVW